MLFYVYILKCSDGTYYIGNTNNLNKRLDAHNGVTRGGAKYTKGRRPVELLYYEEYDSVSSALKREFALKKLTKTQKMKLISP